MVFQKLIQTLLGIKQPSPPPPEKAEEAQDSSAEEKPESRAWIGVDLDGTLAEYHNWKGPQHIGRPVPLMVNRVKQWLERGYRVKVVTARASIPELIPPVEKWLKKQGLEGLEVTNQKDFDMLELWDDRAIQVLPNTGKPVLKASYIGLPKSPLLDKEEPGTTFEPAG